jgi:aminomethyltransferase
VTGDLQRTAIYDWHASHGGKLVPFAGYAMPVQYQAGVLKEHLWTRAKAGLFDVSHMGQALLSAEDGKHETVATVLEALVPADIFNLKAGHQRYTQLLNTDGGIIDDLMVSRFLDQKASGILNIVVNASRKEYDYQHIRAALPSNVKLLRKDDCALLAVQGPAAEDVVGRLHPEAATIDHRGGD